MKNFIIFKKINKTGIIHLNRPETLNALNLEMAEAFLKQSYNSLLQHCPMGLAITVELLNKAKNLSLKECLEMECQLSQHIVYRNDFNNCVEAILVSKTYNPAWSPATIHDINFVEVNKFFEPHIEPLNLK